MIIPSTPSKPPSSEKEMTSSSHSKEEIVISDIINRINTDKKKGVSLIANMLSATLNNYKRMTDGTSIDLTGAKNRGDIINILENHKKK